MRGPAYDSEDPLTRALAPPPDETPEQREVRLNKEAEAQRVSDLIDESLRAERTAWKKRKVMKVLLLGQSESGELRCVLFLQVRRSCTRVLLFTGKTTTLKSERPLFLDCHTTVDIMLFEQICSSPLPRRLGLLRESRGAP